MRPKGEALAWGIFAGITLLGWAGSMAIRRGGLESGEWEDEASDVDGSSDEEADLGR